MMFDPYLDFKPSSGFDKKYNMTPEENTLLAKRNVVDSIWKSAKLEGANVTFPDTYTIYENGVISNVSVEDILTVINLKHGWEYVLSEIGKPTTLETLFNIQARVARDQALTTGVLRTGKVGISGTSYIPEIPKREDVEDQLDFILDNPNPTDKALNMMCWCMKSQLFFDGNKRTAMLAANKIMIENGCGVISISVDDIQKFSILLSDYYTNGNINEFKRFIYDNCIDGIIYEKDAAKAAFPEVKEDNNKTNNNNKRFYRHKDFDDEI